MRAKQLVRGNRARACSSRRWPRSSACRGGAITTFGPWPTFQRSASARTRCPRTRSGSNSAVSIQRRISRNRSRATPCRSARVSAMKSETAITRWAPVIAAAPGRRATVSGSCTVTTKGIPAVRAASVPHTAGPGAWAWTTAMRSSRMARASRPLLRQTAKRPSASSGSGRCVAPAAESSRRSVPPAEATKERKPRDRR
jgi:hypothetical protein